MFLWITCGYLALAAAFYLGLTASVTDAAIPTLGHRRGWHRARSLKRESVLRRLRSFGAKRGR